MVYSMLMQKNRMLSLIYTTILKEFGVSAIKAIFSNPDLVLEGRTLSKRELCTLLFERKSQWIPLSYLFAIFDNIEAYLLEQNYLPSLFIEKLLAVQDAGLPILSGQEVLQIIEPHLHEAFIDKDLHQFILKMACYVSNDCISGSTMNIVATREKEESVENYLEVRLKDVDPQEYIYNIDLWRSSQLKRATSGFNIPHFDTMIAIAEVTPIIHFFAEDHIIVKNGKIFLGNLKIGYQQRYSQFLEEQGITENLFLGDNPMGTVLTTSYPVTKHRKLKKNCFYGAPTYLIKSKYTNYPTNTHRLLQTLVHSNLAEVAEPEPIIVERHNTLIEKHKEEISISYCTLNEKFFINNKLLARSTPARFLYLFCQNYLAEGKKSYTYQELLLSEELALDPYRPNISVQIQRLQEKLQKNFPFFKINQVGKGSCSFYSTIPFELTVLK